MARLIGGTNSSNYGEKTFVSKACEYLDNNHIIYWNRQLYGREFDVCILMPEKGILVVELKGWREENILRVENNEYVVIQTTDGEITSSPQKQARGYRFSLERHLRQSIDKFPLVCQLVCLPQVSKAFYHTHRLDVVMEEKFTILKEDLTDKVSFFNKLDQILRETNTWHRDSFNERTMLEVRNLFETNIDLNEAMADNTSLTNSGFHQHDYSRFLYLSANETLSDEEISNYVIEYLSGCKIYGVFSDSTQLHKLADALDSALKGRRLIRNGENLDYSFTDTCENSNRPVLSNESKNFKAFHISLSALSNPVNIPSIRISNGNASDDQVIFLKKIADASSFNVEQYAL